jgi:hypothetical protein
LRWIHFLAGITWIGLLYYFNFVQTRSSPRPGPGANGGHPARAAGALVVPLGRDVHLPVRLAHHVTVPQGWVLRRSYGWAILLGGLLGTMMWANGS